MMENCCAECVWYRNRNGTHGLCMNPHNAEAGWAGSDYSSSDIMRPATVMPHKVCEAFFHGPRPTIREAYQVKWVAEIGYGYPGRFVRVDDDSAKE